MPSGKTAKLVVFEALQFAGLSAPLFVVMERFAGLMRDVREGGGGDPTAYWLVVAASLAYVTSATLLVWLPLKFLMLRRRGFLANVTQWRPAALAYVILCPLPCFAILIAGSKVQVDRGQKLDHFRELPVSLVLFSLICVDVIERIRFYSLTGRGSLDADFNVQGLVLTHLEQVNTVSSQLHTDGSQGGPPLGDPEVPNGTPPRRRYPSEEPRGPSTAGSRAYLYPSSARRPWGVVRSRDARAELFVDSFLFWLDTAEMLRVAGEPAVFYSAWVSPVYVLVFLSTLRLAFAPQNPALPSAGVALQDLPFFVLRVALAAALGHVTPLLYAMKNLAVCLSYVYFCLLTRLRVLDRHSMF